MKTKEEVIREAWGGAYGGDMIDNGWKPINSVFIIDTLRVDYSECEKYVRPKSLQGIEDNNGWISIKSEEDLPNTWTKVHFIIKGFEETEYCGFFDGDLFWNLNEAYTKEIVTHYKPITKPKPPLHD